MHKYATEARHRANELLWMLTDDERQTLQNWMLEDGNVDFPAMVIKPAPRVLTILSQTPAQDDRWRQKKGTATFLREWLAARHWALTAANALQNAADVQDAVVRQYRRSCRRVAQAAGRFPAPVDAEDWLWLEMDG